MTPPPTVRHDGSGLAGLVALAAAGGAVGAVLRHLLTLTTDGDGLLGVTLVVNAVGSLLLGLLPLIDGVRRSEGWRVAVGPGLLGGFTTLSAVNEQSRSLLAHDRVLLAGGYLIGTLVVCVGAATLAALVVSRVAADRAGRRRT